MRFVIAGSRRPPVRLLAVWLSATCFVLAGCGERAVGQAEETGSYGIDWHEGSVESAFRLARAQGTPVLLYWGADWCPPCSRLKATVFKSRAFIERSRLFVPVSLDGDEPGAQKLGDRFEVDGYPTMIVLAPNGDEITRIDTILDLDRYLEAIDVALAATRPVTGAYEATANGLATAADYRLLAYYSWAQDRERLVPEERLPDALRTLHGSIPRELAVERALLFLHYLTAFGNAADEDDPAPPLPAGERPAAQERMLEILRDPALTAAVQLHVVFGVHWLLPMIAQPDDAGRTALEDAWETAIERIRRVRTSPADRVATYFGEICLAFAREPDRELPESLVRRARQAVLRAARNTDDPYARLALFGSAMAVLTQIGFDDATWDYAMDEVEQSLKPETVMWALGSVFERDMDSGKALYWMDLAWQAAAGPTTRFEHGSLLVLSKIALTPEDFIGIEKTTIAAFRELGAEPDAFYNRVMREMAHLETELYEWNAEGAHDASLARIRAAVLKVCATIPAGDQSRTNCESFLASTGRDLLG